MSDVKNKLKQGKSTIGSWMQIPDTSVAEIMGKAGYDWVAVDLEHGRFSQEKLPDLFRALELGGTVPLARIAQALAKDIKQALDAGAQGLIFPMIESAEQLRQAISWSLYPPFGSRGVGYARANLFGKQFDEYVKNAHHLLFIAQIEHIEAVKQLDSILRVAHLDGIMVGPYDLSASMGLTAQFEHPEFLEVMETIRTKALEAQIPMGAHVVQNVPAALQEKLAQGYQFLAYSIDALFLYKSAQNPVMERKK
ncbi:aldolase/citrate lyase family protein [Deltaproteobacteria bacterium TL4]